MENKSKSLEFLFEQAKKQDSKSSYEKTTELFNNNLQEGKQVKALKEYNSYFKFKTLLIMTGAIITIIALSIFAYNKAETLEKDQKQEKANHALLAEDKGEAEGPLISFGGSQTEAVVSSIEVQNDSAFDRTTTYETQKNGELISKIVFDYRADYNLAPENEVIPRFVEEPYRFPVLNESQIDENNKVKNKMIKRLAKMDGKYYVFIPSGKYKVDEKDVAVRAFYMRNTEVTLLEYRTFLYDLLITNRKSDFLIAKPNQELWMTLGTTNEPMKNLYFSHPAYNDYPVNNISREGAKLYCKWLSEEVGKLDEGKRKYKVGKARIPTDMEWMWAAYGGNNEAYLYPWKTNSIMKDSACYLANFKPMVPDSTGKLVNSYFADGGFFTVKADSYFSNDFGLYNMSGNLAEMVVFSKENNTPGTKGGSWMDDEEELVITASDAHKGETEPNLAIGFRPVFTFIGN